MSHRLLTTGESIRFQIGSKIITKPLPARDLDGIRPFTDLAGQTSFVENLEIGQLIPDFFKAERVELFALGIFDVAERTFGSGDFGEVVEQRIEQLGRNRVLIRHRFVTNLFDGLQLWMLKDFREYPLLVRVGNDRQRIRILQRRRCPRRRMSPTRFRRRCRRGDGVHPFFLFADDIGVTRVSGVVRGLVGQ